MNKKAIVISLENSQIQVKILQKDDCATCTAGCAKNSALIKVNNPKDFPLKAGTIVQLQSSAKIQAIQGLFSLFIPFFCAIAGYFLAQPVAGLFNKACSDLHRAIGVLSMLIISSLSIYLITRKIPLPGTPEIFSIEN